MSIEAERKATQDVNSSLINTGIKGVNQVLDSGKSPVRNASRTRETRQLARLRPRRSRERYVLHIRSLQCQRLRY